MIYYLIVLSLITYVVFYFDKRRAVNGGKRVSEKNLLLLSLLGGAMGGLLAMKMHRHKTRKRLFTFLMPLFIVIHILVYFLLDKRI